MRRAMMVLGFVVLQALHGACAAVTLDILLTNDDGYDAPGITAVRAALLEAGHRVMLVAPLTQQSATGVKVTIGEMAVTRHGTGIWTVDGSPADAVSYALARIYAGDPPDLVVSGANLGQNLGSNVVSSGTVGAAVMAVQNGVPAIAVSVGLDLAEAGAGPERFPSTLAAFPQAAALTARVVAALAAGAAPGSPLLPPELVLNINYPALPANGIKGMRMAPLGRYGGFRLIYPERAGKPRVLSTIEPDPRALADEEADTGLFAQGYVTFSALTPDWNAEAKVSDAVAERLGTLEELRGGP